MTEENPETTLPKATIDEGQVEGAAQANGQKEAEAAEAAEAEREREEMLTAMMQHPGKEKLKAASNGDISKKEKTALINAMFGGANKKKMSGVAEASSKPHKFWDTQPMKKLSEEVTEFGPIDPPKTPEDVRQTPYTLPKGFEWVTMDVLDEAQIQDIYKLLTENYVEDDDAMFRFDYSVPFLQWALTPPGYIKSWHVGVVQTSNRRLRGFISGIPADFQICTTHRKGAEINFLCVHRKLRSKRLAPVLIKEVTRRVNLLDQWQAVYTAGVVLPKPVAQCHYWHRSINPKKLVDIGFSRLGPRMTMNRQQKLYKLPPKPKNAGFRQMLPKDMPQVFKLLAEYLTKFKLYVRYTEKELAHWILPRKGVVNSFVVENDGVVTDFCSYYHLPSSILKHEKHKTLNAIYSYYNVATSIELPELMRDCLIAARDDGCDVFNCLDLMENELFLKPLKFGIGDGKLQYYLYNWMCPEMSPGDVGIVLL
jgi:glycylpeptide N-tetradecanoyltransferase